MKEFPRFSDAKFQIQLPPNRAALSVLGIVSFIRDIDRLVETQDIQILAQDTEFHYQVKLPEEYLTSIQNLDVISVELLQIFADQYKHQLNDDVVNIELNLLQMKLMFTVISCLERTHNGPFLGSLEAFKSQLIDSHSLDVNSEPFSTATLIKPIFEALCFDYTDSYYTIHNQYLDVVNAHIHEYCTNNFESDLLAIPQGHQLRLEHYEH